MNFPQNLKLLRLQCGFTQTELAKKVHLSRTAISNYESGRMEPSIQVLIKLAEIFGVTVDELIK